MSKCYVIIINYKKWEDTLECLRRLFESNYHNLTVVVIDNDSKNQSLENIILEIKSSPLIRRADGSNVAYCHIETNDLSQKNVLDASPVLLVQNNYNAGFAAANNIALRCLLERDAYIWLLNPDITVDANTLDHLIDTASLLPQSLIGAVTKSFYDKEKTLFYGGGSVNFKSATIRYIKEKNSIPQLQYISGGCLLMHSSVLRKLGLLPEDYFLYWEDADYSFYATKMGIDLKVSLQAICYDKISTSIGRGFISDYYYVRNGLTFVSKYKKNYLPIAFLVIVPRIIKKIVRGEFSRVRGIVQGTIDFLINHRYENK